MAENRADLDSAGGFATFEDEVYSYSMEGPGRKSPATDDPLQDTLDTLYSEHRYISSLLDTLEQQAARLKPGKVPDYQLLLDIVDYLTHYPDQYHHPREDLLFSSMLKRDKAFRTRLDRLEREHQALHHYNRDLLHELTRIAEGRPVDRPELLQSIRRYIAGYRQHMDYESSEIFPRAKGSLSAADVRKLSAKTRYIDDPLFGGEIQYQYQRLGRNLQTRVESAGQELIAREMSGIESAIENLSELVERAGQLKTALGGRGRDAWREQIDTLRDHARLGSGPNVLGLPLALAKNHQRYLSEGFAEIRDILRRGGSDQQSAASAGDSGKGRPGRQPSRR